LKSLKNTLTLWQHAANVKSHFTMCCFLFRDVVRFNCSVSQHQVFTSMNFYGPGVLPAAHLTVSIHSAHKSKRHKPHTATAAALYMSQRERAYSLIGRRLSLRPQTDLRPTSHTPPWSAV